MLLKGMLLQIEINTYRIPFTNLPKMQSYKAKREIIKPMMAIKEIE